MEHYRTHPQVPTCPICPAPASVSDAGFSNAFYLGVEKCMFVLKGAVFQFNMCYFLLLQASNLKSSSCPFFAGIRAAGAGLCGKLRAAQRGGVERPAAAGGGAGGGGAGGSAALVGGAAGARGRH